MTLTKFLEDRLAQLEHRKMMIPRYVNRPGNFLGKKDFSLEDLPKIEEEIEETKASLKAIADLKKKLRTLKFLNKPNNHVRKNL